MIKLLNIVRVLCIVLALLVLTSSLIFAALKRSAPLTLIERLAIALPLLAIFNVATTYIRKNKPSPQEPKERG